MSSRPPFSSCAPTTETSCSQRSASTGGLDGNLLYRIRLQTHIPGKLNIVADQMSRLCAPHKVKDDYLSHPHRSRCAHRSAAPPHLSTCLLRPGAPRAPPNANRAGGIRCIPPAHRLLPPEQLPTPRSAAANSRTLSTTGSACGVPLENRQPALDPPFFYQISSKGAHHQSAQRHFW
jgi:hypothetical protein